MLTEFIELEKTEHGAKKEGLELVDLLWEDHLKMLVDRLKNKLEMMKDFVMELRENSRREGREANPLGLVL